MTAQEYAQYNLIVRSSYMNYVVNLYNKAQVTELDLKFEFDTRLWILAKAKNIVLNYDLDGHNKFTTTQMLKWQTIMNNIMKTRHFVDFIIE